MFEIISNATEKLHIVQKGETLYSISKALNISIEKLKSINPSLDGKTIFVGQKILLNNKEEPEFNNVIKDPFYIVKSGDTIFSIAMKYKIPTKKIIEFNNLNNNQIKIGQKIFLNNNKNLNIEIKKDIIKTIDVPVNKHQLDINNQYDYIRDIGFILPVNGKIVSNFFHKSKGDGVYILGKIGDFVRAAASGRVIYVGDDLKDFGKLIIIKHYNGFLSAYGHSSGIIVSAGNRIKQGQIIAYLGPTKQGADDGKLYFSIRKNNMVFDPLKLIRKSQL